MAGENETRISSEIIEQRAKDFFGGVKIGSARLLGLCDALDFTSSRRHLTSLRQRVVTARNSRGIWDRLTGKTTLEVVTAESELRVGEQTVVSIETRMQERESTLQNYTSSHIATANFLDDLTGAYDEEFRVVGNRDRTMFRSSEELAHETLMEISNEIMSPPIKTQENER